MHGNLIDMIGKRVGHLTVIGRAGSTKKGVATWKCLCECGNEGTVRGDGLRRGTSKSCGCLTRNGKSYTRLYEIWKNMISRCTNSHIPSYYWYGGRGITVCPEWEDFDTFEEWAYSHGYREYLTIDRIDNDKGYFPDNCRWATGKNRQTIGVRETENEEDFKMKKDINVQIMDDLMNAITQTDAWERIQLEDPAILKARARWEKALERVESLIPRDLYVELADAEAGNFSAMGDAGILYGIHVVFAMRDVAARPSDLSQHVLDRMEGKA